MKLHILLLILSFYLYAPKAFSQGEPDLCELYCEAQEFFIPCDPTAPPTDVEWNNACARLTVELCEGVFCEIDVCYCWRHTTDFDCCGWDYSIRAIIVRNPCEGCDPSLVELLDKAFDALIINNAGGFPCPECPDNTQEWQEVRGRCWKEEIIMHNGLELKFAKICSDPGWCFKKWGVCCLASNGQVRKTLMSITSTGACAKEGCTVVGCQ